MKDVGKFYGHFVYFIDIWYIVWPFGIFCGQFGKFFPFWYVVPKKSGNPDLKSRILKLLSCKHFKNATLANMPNQRKQN
jgi:hypothetical protein